MIEYNFEDEAKNVAIATIEINEYIQTFGRNSPRRFHMGATLSGYLEKKFLGWKSNSIHCTTEHLPEDIENVPIA